MQQPSRPELRRCLSSGLAAAILGLGVSLGLIGPLAAAEPTLPPAPPAPIQLAGRDLDLAAAQDAALFAWYDGLGLPSPAGKPFGRLTGLVQSNPFTGATGSVSGFLLEDTPAHWTLLTGWHVVVIPKPGAVPAAGAPNAPNATGATSASDAANATEAPAASGPAGAKTAPPTFEKRDIAHELDQALQSKPDADDRFPHFLGFDQLWCDDDLYFFLLARNADQNGLHARSRALMQRATAAATQELHLMNLKQELDTLPVTAGLDADHLALQKYLGAELPMALLTYLYIDWENPLIPRADLLLPVQVIATQFPKAQLADTAADLTHQLKIEIAEDAARAQQPVKPWARMTQAEQIDELIFQLRDQSESDSIFMRAFNPNLPASSFPPSHTPADQLLALGWTALPALIAHLDDRRVTRCVVRPPASRPTLPFERDVLRVNDFAETMIFCVTRHSCYPPARNGPEYLGRIADPAKFKKAAQAWWAELQKKGFDAMLTEAVARGDTDSIAAATRLIQRHPEAGIQAAIAAVPNCPAPTIRDDMIALIAAQKDPAVLPFLQSELKDSSSNARRYAAELLFRRGDTSGIPVACQDLIFAVAHPPPDSTRDDWPSPTRLSSFLLSSGDPAAVACALKVFPSLSDADRGDILQGGLAPIPKSGTVETAVDVQLDAFLVNCLDDNGFIDGCINHAVNPRNGDMAADDLIQRWHLSRPVPFNADFRTRLTLRTQLKNRWRREHDQPPLKLPAAPAIPTADPVHLKQLAAQLTAAQTPQAVQAVLADYDTLGLPGFAPLSAALAALPAGHPALAPGRVELSRLASILRSVEFADGSAPLPPALDAPLRKMIGRPLDAAALCDWLQDYCLAPARRLYVDLDRASDGSGVSLHLWLGPASAPTATLFSYSTTYFLAGKDIGGAGANCEARDTGTKNFFQSDCASLTQILTAAPTELGIARIDLVWKPE